MPTAELSPDLVPAPSAAALANDFVRAGRRWLVVALVVWAAAAWFVVVPHGIGYSWRECDTQAIARNFLADGFDPLHPRVDWRGDGAGFVECEFPLYQSMIATTMAVFGDVEWPGRVLSMLSILVATLSLHRLLEWRTGPRGALAGALVFLCGGHAMLLGCRVMPDALSTALALAGLVTFVRFLENGRSTALWLAIAALTFAALQKPTALQVGLLAFGWTVVFAPRRLREPRVWCGFAAVLAIVAAWLLHARSLHDATGLTFGVLGNGDTKFPDFEHLLQPRIYAQLARTTLFYGFAVFGFVALIVASARGRVDRADRVLLGTVVLGLVGTLRYSYHHAIGPHYHVFAAVAGAWFVARAWPAANERTPRWLWPMFLLAVAAHGTWQLQVERRKAEVCSSAMSLGLATALRALSAPTDLAVLRAEKPLVDATWRRRNNFEDPRLFYHAQRRGWILPADGFDVATLRDLHERGARLVVDVLPHRTPPEVTSWLDDHGDVVLREAGVVVHRLRTSD